MVSLDFIESNIASAAAAIAAGTISIQGFGNIYAMVSLPDAAVVQRVNRLKGRPPAQTGSLLTTRRHVPLAWDWDRLPAGVGRDALLALVHALLDIGPCGFRGPAAATVPDHLAASDGSIRTTQIIAPGHRCPSNRLIDATLAAADLSLLHVTSANRSHTLTGTLEEPAHYRADALAREFAGDDVLLLRHRDEPAAARAHPLHAPMSTTVIAFHRALPGATPVLVVERHGSLPYETARAVARQHGFDLVLGPAAGRRLAQRSYERPPDLARRGKTA